MSPTLAGEFFTSELLRKLYVFNAGEQRNTWALLSTGFSRQEDWSGLPFPSPGDLTDPGIKPKSPALAGGFFTTEPFFFLTENFHTIFRFTA